MRSRFIIFLMVSLAIKFIIFIPNNWGEKENQIQITAVLLSKSYLQTLVSVSCHGYLTVNSRYWWRSLFFLSLGHDWDEFNKSYNITKEIMQRN